MSGSARWCRSRAAPGVEKWIVLWAGPCAARCWPGFEPGYADAWLVLTDLAPQAADVVWYSMRAWIEAGFKDTKRGGWQWHQTKMTDPARASRLWLAIAVATLWVLSVGGEADATQSESRVGSVTGVTYRPAHRHQTVAPAAPELLCEKRLRRIFVAVLHRRRLPLGRFIPEPWPTTMPPRKPSTKQRGSLPSASTAPSPSQAAV